MALVVDACKKGHNYAERATKAGKTVSYAPCWFEMTEHHTAYIRSPVGALFLSERSGRLHSVEWVNELPNQIHEPPTGSVLAEAVAQLAAYFDRRLQVFDLPLEVSASPLVQAVCEEMLAISFGETKTYGQLAKDVGAPPQAVGQACGANPIPIVIPCHRVLSAKGLGGYSGSGGVETKVLLLRHEGAAGLLL